MRSISLVGFLLLVLAALPLGCRSKTAESKPPEKTDGGGPPKEKVFVPPEKVKPG